MDKIVKVPYTTDPYMEKYEGPHLDQYPADSRITGPKFFEYTKFPPFTLCFESELSKKNELLMKVAGSLNIRQCKSMFDLGLSIHPDIVIMHNGRLEAAFVAYPSGWNPGSQIGKTLAEIHNPVADGERLRQMSDRLSKLMCGKYSYHRHVWTLASTGQKSMHPSYTFPEPKNVNDLWFRMEHQITVPVVENETSAFLIYVSTIKYEHLQQNERELIRDSINSMSDAVVEYKHLKKVKEILNDSF